MHPRAEQLIRDLGLQPHPEGGWYCQTYKSDEQITAEGELSRWHRVRFEEIWHFYEGAPLDLLQLTPNGAELERFVLGPVSDQERPVHRVPPAHWQAARSRGAFTLVGCTVAPAFQFADFALLKNSTTLAAFIRRKHPAVAEFV